MSWGHAVSTDLVHLGRAAGRDPARTSTPTGGRVELVFSGSAVVDGDDLVAVYTSVALPSTPEAPGLQTQHLARSTDGGETWIKDPANPVLDRGSTDFRDPKVFRDGDRWLMAAVEAVEQKVVLYASDDLHAWTLLSEFADAASRTVRGSARTCSRSPSTAATRSGGCCWSACSPVLRVAAAGCAGGWATSTARRSHPSTVTGSTTAATATPRSPGTTPPTAAG